MRNLTYLSRLFTHIHRYCDLHLWHINFSNISDCLNATITKCLTSPNVFSKHDLMQYFPRHQHPPNWNVCLHYRWHLLRKCSLSIFINPEKYIQWAQLWNELQINFFLQLTRQLLGSLLTECLIYNIAWY